jgi:hypothetical protein
MAHAGQHMDEIAFAVVTKPYKDWEFYTDSSSSRSGSDLDTYFGVPTGDAEHDARRRQRQDHQSLSLSSPHLPRLKEELARLERNREGRIQREKAKGIDASAPGSDHSKPIQQTKGTHRKCANCGQVGHIKTNKKYANSLLLVDPNLLNSISRGRFSLVITFLLDSAPYSMARSRTQRSRLMRLDS